MNTDRQRIVEIRLIVIVLIDVTEPTFTEALRVSGRSSSLLSEVVSSEIVSNLESLAYVESVIVTQL